VEILVAFGLASIFLPAIIIGFISGSSGKAQQELRLKAVGLLKEGEEAARSARDGSWTNISVNGTYYPKVVNNAWILTNDQAYKTVGDFERSIVISDVSPADPSKKKIVVTVTWVNVFPTTISDNFYLTRWKNISSSLTASGTLLNQGNGDWCAPSLSLGSVDLGNATAQSISATQGQVTTGTGQAAAGFTFVNALLTDPQYPATPSASAVNTFNGPTKTNDVFGNPLKEKSYSLLPIVI